MNLNQSNDIKIMCVSCGHNVEPVVYESGQHLRADCPVCGRYIKFLNKKEKGKDMAELEMFFEYPDNKFGI